MKRFLIFCLYVCFGFLNAQQPTEIPGNLAELLNVPYFISPTGQNSTTFTFDKKITVEATGADGKKFDLFIYINTSNGNVGSFSGKPGTFGNGEINPENEKFRFTIQKPNGTITTFFNTKKKNNLLHRFSTLNTEIDPLEIGQLNSSVHRTGNTKTVLTQGFTAAEYSGSGSNRSTYLCGAINQSQFIFSKFLGFSSIGYAKTNHGIVMIVENASSAGSFKAKKWQNGNYTFDMSNFESIESETFAKANTQIENKITKIQSKESDSENCRDLEEELKRVKLENLNKSKDAIAQANSGNLYDNMEAIEGLTKMGDLKPAMMEAIIDNELQICEMEHRDLIYDSEFERLNCLRNKRSDLNQAYMRMTALEEEFEGQPAKIHMEKMKLLNNISQMESCR
jgi:hypothetical protein